MGQYQTKTSSLARLLEVRAQAMPDKTAFIFLGEKGEHKISYQKLAERASQTAASLLSLKFPTEKPAVLLFDDGQDFLHAFWACVWAGITAIPLPAVNAKRFGQQLLPAIQNSGAAFILTTSTYQKRLLNNLPPESLAIPLLSWEELKSASSAFKSGSAFVDQDLPLIQYTSGSTSRPKGVKVSWENLRANLNAIKKAMHVHNDTIGACWLPHYHDMGLISSYIGTVYHGIESVLMQPSYFVEKPIRWLKAIHDHKANISGGPNFAYELCSQKISESEAAFLDLSSWELAYCGAEPIDARTLEIFAEKFSPLGFRPEAVSPCYGMAEATLMISCKTFGQKPLFVPSTSVSNEGYGMPEYLTSCGLPCEGMKVIITKENGLIAGTGETGEICVHGTSVTDGFWNSPEDDETAFGYFLGERFLKTGDLGFLTEKGEVVVAGRLKETLIVRGKNFYPYDLENDLMRAFKGQILACALFSVHTNGRETPILAVEMERLLSEEKKCRALLPKILRRASEFHGFFPEKVVFLSHGKIPRTSSGKTQRAECKSMWIKSLFEPIFISEREIEKTAPIHLGITEEERLTAIIKQICPGVKIAPNDSFASLGIESIMLPDLLDAVRNGFETQIPASAIAEYDTVHSLAVFIRSQKDAKPLSIKALPNTQENIFLQIKGRELSKNIVFPDFSKIKHLYDED